MPKRSILLVGIIVLILATALYQIPGVNSRIAWRYEVAKTYAKNVINPIGEVPTVIPNRASY